MPELPDVEVYVACLARRVAGEPLEDVRVAEPSLLRTLEELETRRERRAARPPSPDGDG